MNIAHLLPYSALFPLVKHNGRYEWVLRLARLQADNGHSVTIYAASGSSDSSNIIWRSSPYDFKNKTVNNVALIQTAIRDTSQDIYHSHFDYLHYFLSHETQKPILFTQHWFPNEDIAAAARFDMNGKVIAVPATRHMAEENDRLSIPSTAPIRHGIDLSLFKNSQQEVGDRLIFVGRITRNKGVLEAVRIARAANQGLDIVGKLNNSDKSYWQEIEPLIDGSQIKYLGAKTQPEIALLFSKAKAFIFPSQVQEAFGQVTIEAQACGAPVIISDIGASHELIDQGKTGFVVNSESEFVDAINNIGKFNREDCRRFAQQFDLYKTVNSYDQLYIDLLRR